MTQEVYQTGPSQSERRATPLVMQSLSYSLDANKMLVTTDFMACSRKETRVKPLSRPYDQYRWLTTFTPILRRFPNKLFSRSPIFSRPTKDQGLSTIIPSACGHRYLGLVNSLSTRNFQPTTCKHATLVPDDRYHLDYMGVRLSYSKTGTFWRK